MFRLDLMQEEAHTLVMLLTNKMKEIHAWRIATKSGVRDEEYDKIATLLKKLAITKGG